MSCFGSDAKWKREKIQDHKFDYIDVDDFVSKSFSSYAKYGLVYIMTLKSIFIYMGEMLIIILLILIKTAAVEGIPDPTTGGALGEQNVNGSSGEQKLKAKEDFFGEWLNQDVKMGLIIASVFVSYILLVFEWRKAFTIIQSKDISYAFTSTIAYRYYAIRSYPHFCVFDKINKSKKVKDTLSLWNDILGWKKVLFAESPRQIIQLLLIASAVRSTDKSDSNFVMKYITTVQYFRKQDFVLFATLLLTSLVVFIWLFTLVTLVIAFFVYLFLLQSIRGNLKEYCVHKIDKRIDNLLKKKSRKRVLEARKAELEELEKNRDSIDIRAAPPLGMAVGPRYPNVMLNNNNDAYGSEYGGYGYSRSEYGGPNRLMLPAPAGGSQYAGSDYAGSEVGAPVRHGHGKYATSEYSSRSYGALNPVYNPSVSGSQSGYYHTNGNYYQASAASEYGGESSTWQQVYYSGNNPSYIGQRLERTLSPKSPEGLRSPKSSSNNYYS